MRARDLGIEIGSGHLTKLKGTGAPFPCESCRFRLVQAIPRDRLNGLELPG